MSNVTTADILTFFWRPRAIGEFEPTSNQSPVYQFCPLITLLQTAFKCIFSAEGQARAVLDCKANNKGLDSRT